MFYKNVGWITILYVSYRYPILRGGPCRSCPPLHKFAETQSWDELFKPHCVVALRLKLKRFSMHVNEKGVCTNSSRNEKCNENKHWVLKVFESQMKRISIYKCQSQKNLVGWHIHPDLRLLDWIIYLPHRTRASRLELIYWNLSLNWAKSNFQHFSVSNKVFSIHPWLGSRLCSLGELSTVFTM